MTIYMLKFCGETRTYHTRPFKVVEKYENHVLLELMQYPCDYGITRPFKMSASKLELKEAEKMNPQQFIQWAEKRKEFADTVLTAHKGNSSAKEVLHEWDRIKADLRKSG